ncbi:MAG: thiamine biosynthesis lipoprotein [Planctomycetota bacterium]|jgi:thiamine biosynthesis lipoprotein
MVAIPSELHDDCLARATPDCTLGCTLRGALLFIACVSGACRAIGSSPEPLRFIYEQMGTRFEIRVHGVDSELAQTAASAAFGRLDVLNACLSDYDPKSELRSLCAHFESQTSTPKAVSDDLWHVLELARQVSVASEGAFDVSVGRAVRLWRRMQRQGELPGAERLREARESIGYELIELHDEPRAIRLSRAGMRLDLGGIAKGYALDEMLVVLASYGVESALVDGGGDIAVSGPPPGQDSWTIRVESMVAGAPTRELRLVHGAVATSGDAYRSIEVEGVRYSHIVDPRTAMGVTRRVAASVVAPSGAIADALASALCVRGPEDLAFLAAWSGVRARVISLGPGGEIVQQEWPIETGGKGMRAR